VNETDAKIARGAVFDIDGYRLKAVVGCTREGVFESRCHRQPRKGGNKEIVEFHWSNP
jgi:hypothetical protein